MKIYRFISFAIILILMLWAVGCSYTSKPLEPVVPVEDRQAINIPEGSDEGVKYERAYKDSTVILAASDLQDFYNMEEVNCINRMSKMLDNVDESIIFDGFLFCGDYDTGSQLATETNKGINALTEFMSTRMADDDRIFIKGNHDAIEAFGISATGGHDTDEYGVFVMNDDDYSSDTVEVTTQKLIDYLNEKLKAKYEKPIFVVSHAPMHYSMRTPEHYTSVHSKLYFDVLNEAGDKGLNIIFLFGHNHSGGWDDYLGGGAIFLTKGDSINICTGEVEEFETRTLNFTYMNAGYVGYYILVNKGACDLLSMSVIEITDGAVSFARVSTEGVEPLKAAGVRNTENAETQYDPDTTEIQSYFELELTKVRSTRPIKDILDEEAVKPPKEAHYRRISKEEDIKDGGKYLLVVRERDEDYYYVMTPEIKKSNTGGTSGIALLPAPSYEEEYVISTRFIGHEWILTKTTDGWLFGSDSGYITLAVQSDEAANAELSATGSAFSMKDHIGIFMIRSGDYYLHHDTVKDSIDGAADEAAYIYIYKYVE